MIFRFNRTIIDLKGGKNVKTLKEIREEHGLTGKQLAVLFNVAPSTIFNMETDSSNIKNTLLQQYIRAFKIPYDQIFLGNKYDTTEFLRKKKENLLKNLIKDKKKE